MSYSEENGMVLLRLNREEYEHILLALGAYAAMTDRDNRQFELINRINQGNPKYTPYST